MSNGRLNAFEMAVKIGCKVRSSWINGGGVY